MIQQLSELRDPRPEIDTEHRAVADDSLCSLEMQRSESSGKLSRLARELRRYTLEEADFPSQGCAASVISD